LADTHWLSQLLAPALLLGLLALTAHLRRADSTPQAHSSWTGKDPYEEFRGSRIPGSRFFDLDRISAPDTDLPHMLPSPAAFGAAADALDIANESDVVVYDRSGCFSAPRVWWTFRAFGHNRCAPYPLRDPRVACHISHAGCMRPGLLQSEGCTNEAALPPPCHAVLLHVVACFASVRRSHRADLRGPRHAQGGRAERRPARVARPGPARRRGARRRGRAGGPGGGGLQPAARQPALPRAPAGTATLPTCQPAGLACDAGASCCHIRRHVKQHAMLGRPAGTSDAPPGGTPHACLTQVRLWVWGSSG